MFINDRAGTQCRSLDSRLRGNGIDAMDKNNASQRSGFPPAPEQRTLKRNSVKALAGRETAAMLRHHADSHRFRNNTILPLIIAALTTFWCGSCFSQQTATRSPNVVLIVSDDQRPDTIHALGNDIIKTPALDRLVREGMAFTQATCANPICTPSRAEILTGCTGFRCGVMDFGGKDRVRPNHHASLVSLSRLHHLLCG
jgi:hypothetical protein